MKDYILKQKVIKILEGFMGGSSPDNPTLAPSQKDSNAENSVGFNKDESTEYNKILAAKKTTELSDLAAAKIGGESKLRASNALKLAGNNIDEDLSEEELGFVKNLFSVIKGKI